MLRRIERLLRKFQTKYLNRRMVFVMDLLLSVIASAVLLLFINLLAQSGYYAGRFFWIYMAFSFAFSAILIYLSKCYTIIIRHLSIRDLVPFFLVALLKALLIEASFVLVGRINATVLLICFFDFLGTFILMILVRVAMIMVYEQLQSRIKVHRRTMRTLIYGTSDKSAAIVARLKASPHYEIVGFLTRNSALNNSYVERKIIYSFADEDDVKKIFDKTDADAVLFAQVADARNEAEGLVEWCSINKIKTLITPAVDDIKGDSLTMQLREVKIEDLLGREEILIDTEELKGMLSGKVIMVTGAAGSIGSELVRQLARLDVSRVILVDNAETPLHNLRLELEDRFPELDFVPVICDVRIKTRLDYVFRTYHPQVVFHAAAYKHVPLMEENPCEAVMVNVAGSRFVAEKCIEHDVEKMVMISTDKAVNPTNIMGCTKRLAEIYVQSLGLAIEKGIREGSTVFVTTRFGNVLGSNGSVIPRFREQIAAGGPVTVTHPDINRYFMTIPEACRLVMEAATLADSTEIMVFDMGEPVRIDSLARRMITLSGLVPDKDIKIKYTGLRPGEKLYEEVLATEENTLPTRHGSIRIARVRTYDYGGVLPVYDRLQELAQQVEIDEMVRLMKETVPEFISSRNSRFAALDNKE